MLNTELNLKTALTYAYAHGAVDESDWNGIQNACCGINNGLFACVLSLIVCKSIIYRKYP